MTDMGSPFAKMNGIVGLSGALQKSAIFLTQKYGQRRKYKFVIGIALT